MYPIELKGISKVYHPGQRWARTALHDIYLLHCGKAKRALMGASGSGNDVAQKSSADPLRPLPANAASMA